MKKVKFNFRVWVHPEDGDPADIEVWHHELEPTEYGKRSVADWAQESLSCEDFHDLFELEKDKHWQVIGTATIEGYFDCFGDYDEHIYVTEFEKAEVPNSWWDDGDSLTPESSLIHRIGELIRTQDNRITDSPIFIVQERKRDYGFDLDLYDDYVWIDTENDFVEATDDERKQAELEDEAGGRRRWKKTGYKDRWEFVTACFTEQGCKDFIAADGHNHGELRIYAAGSYRNHEFRTVRSFLRDM